VERWVTITGIVSCIALAAFGVASARHGDWAVTIFDAVLIAGWAWLTVVLRREYR
jgi:hypothetical protein